MWLALAIHVLPLVDKSVNNKAEYEFVSLSIGTLVILLLSFDIFKYLVESLYFSKFNFRKQQSFFSSFDSTSMEFKVFLNLICFVSLMTGDVYKGFS